MFIHAGVQIPLDTVEFKDGAFQHFGSWRYRSPIKTDRIPKGNMLLDGPSAKGYLTSLVQKVQGSLAPGFSLLDIGRKLRDVSNDV